MKITKQILLSMCLCGECSYSIYFCNSTIYICSKIENKLYYITWYTHKLKPSIYGVNSISGFNKRARTKEELLDFIKNINEYAEIIRE